MLDAVRCNIRTQHSLRRASSASELDVGTPDFRMLVCGSAVLNETVPVTDYTQILIHCRLNGPGVKTAANMV